MSLAIYYGLKVFTVLTVFLIKLVSSRDICHGDETLCIKSCCNSTDFYRINPEKCHLTWKYFNLSLESKLNVFNGNHRYMNLLVKFWHDVSVPCLRSEDVAFSWYDAHLDVKNSSHIPDYCFRRQYNNKTHQYDLIPLNCATEYTWYRYSRYVIISGLILSVLLLLSTICIYLIIKDLRDNMRLKIFIWYLTSLVVAHSCMITCVHIIWEYYEGLKLVSLVIGFLSSYFFMATFLCMSVIGCEIWITFRELGPANSLRCDQKRYKIYAIYVWSVPIIFYTLFMLTLSSIWSFGPVVIILFLNLFIFVIMSFQICIIRYNVANLREGESIILQTAKTILSMFFMMGIPRIIFFVFLYMSNLAYYMISKYIFLSIEAPLIFKLFVLKSNVWNMLKNRFLYRYTRASTVTDDVSSSP
ncbi:G-protein coupled receptor Mth2-like [Haematobia irritans]|uniref:G-protein coupled receptor Mth2-like n=1 Tax=Haematobia irritans TaxID=7368 RepID=UPI003F4FB871